MVPPHYAQVEGHTQGLSLRSAYQKKKNGAAKNKKKTHRSVVLPVELQYVFRVPALDQLLLPDGEPPEGRVETQAFPRCEK